MSILQGNSCSITQKSGEIWTVQTDLQQIYPKPDRLLNTVAAIEQMESSVMMYPEKELPSDPNNGKIRATHLTHPGSRT